MTPLLYVVIASLTGVALFSVTRSFDEIARTSQAIGARNTLPLELQAMQTNVTTPVIYALGALTTGLSLAVIALAFGCMAIVRALRARHGSDAGAGLV